MPNEPTGYVDLSVVDGDIVWTDGGGLEVVTGDRMTQQSLTRQLGDTLGSLLFEPQHGAGLRSRIQTAINPAELQGISATIFAQIAQNPNVGSVQTVSLQLVDGWLFVTAQIASAFGSSELMLRFPVPPLA